MAESWKIWGQFPVKWICLNPYMVLQYSKEDRLRSDIVPCQAGGVSVFPPPCCYSGDVLHFLCSSTSVLFGPPILLKCLLKMTLHAGLVIFPFRSVLDRLLKKSKSNLAHIVKGEIMVKDPWVFLPQYMQLCFRANVQQYGITTSIDGVIWSTQLS